MKSHLSDLAKMLYLYINCIGTEFNWEINNFGSSPPSLPKQNMMYGLTSQWKSFAVINTCGEYKCTKNKLKVKILCFFFGEEDKHMVECEHFNQERAVQYSAVQSNTCLELNGLIILYLPV